MERPRISMTFCAGKEAVRGAIQSLMQGLRPWDLSADIVGTVELVVAEALNNVVEHAYANAKPPCPIYVVCERDPDGVMVRITDEGAEMPNGIIPGGSLPDTNVGLMDLPEGGFGWFLIHDLADTVEYCRAGQRNVLNLRLYTATG